MFEIDSEIEGPSDTAPRQTDKWEMLQDYIQLRLSLIPQRSSSGGGVFRFERFPFVPQPGPTRAVK